MSDNRAMAAMLLNDAASTVVEKRPGVHGSAEMSFEMIAELWTIYLRHKQRVQKVDEVMVDAVDVAHMMSLLKKARFMYGNPDNVDNFVDDLGYTALAGMIQLPDPDAKMEFGEVVSNVTPQENPVMQSARVKAPAKTRPQTVTREVIDASQFETAVTPMFDEKPVNEKTAEADIYSHKSSEEIAEDLNSVDDDTGESAAALLEKIYKDKQKHGTSV